MRPAVLDFKHVAAAVLAHLANKLAVLTGFLTHVQIIGYIGYSQITEAVDRFSFYFSFFRRRKVFFFLHVRFQNLSNACRGHNNTAVSGRHYSHSGI